MKMSKRFFIVLLTLAVLASSFALSAFAASEPVPGLNCDSLLSYFEEDVIFGYDFSKDEVDYSASLMLGRPESVTQNFVSDDEAAPADKYLSLQIGTTGPKIKNAYFNWNSEEGIESFYVDTTVMVGTTGTNNPKLRIILNSEIFEKVSEGDTTGVNLVTLDFASGVISYLSDVQVEDGKTTYVTTDAEYVLTAGAWYNVSLDYNAESGSVTLTVVNAADAADAVTVSDIYLPFELVKNVRFGVNKSLAEGNVINLASLFAATGNVRFNVSDKQKGVEEEILKIYSAYTSDDISISDKLSVCDSINKVLSYGFSTTNADVNVAINDIKLGSINLYADALADSLTDYSTLDNYYAKRETVDEGLTYATTLEKTDLSPVSAEGLAVIMNNISAIRAADAELKKIEADSLAYIALLGEVGDAVNSDDYGLLIGYYDAAALLNEDSTYEGVTEAGAVLIAISERIDEIKYEAECFFAELDDLANTERDFMERYYHYLKFKDDIYANETYPGVTEALARYNNVVLPDILANIGYAENYITYIERANFSTYISAKEENIKIADGYAELCHPDYPGVEEAKALRLVVLEEIRVQKENANNYIEAVKALSHLSGDALIKGIENALELQKTGDVLGVDGVAEANMKLNQLTSSIELKTRYSEYFISLVNSLESLESAEDIYELLVEAKRAERKADQTFPGVSEASVDLEAYIEAYNDNVYFTNTEFINANEVAVNTVGIGTTANSVANNVIGFIKKIFDDEE